MARVDLLLGTLDVAPAAVDRLARLLDAEETGRAARFRFARDRQRFIVRRGRRREWLGERLGRAPERLTFTIDHHGKPALPNGPFFSASQSGNRMALAIGAVPLGCDIEAIDPAFSWHDVARALFAPAEVEALMQVSGDTARQAFYACWARKEAFVKALGHGLRHPLDAFTVSVTPAARLLAGADGWSIAAPRVDGHAAAVVAREDGSPLAVTVHEPATGLRCWTSAIISPITGRATSIANAA